MRFSIKFSEFGYLDSVVFGNGLIDLVYCHGILVWHVRVVLRVRAKDGLFVF